MSLERIRNGYEPDERPRPLGNGGSVDVPAPSFSADGKWLGMLAPGPQDKVSIFRVHSDGSMELSLHTELKSHGGEITAFALSPNAKTAVVCDESPLCQLWDIQADGYAPIPLHGPQKEIVWAAIFTADSRWVVTVSAGDKGISIWPMTYDGMREAAARTLGRNLSRDEWKQYFPGDQYRKTFPQFQDARE